MQSTEFRQRVIALEVLVERYRIIPIAEEALIIAVCYDSFVERIVLQTGFKVITWGAVGMCPKKIYVDLLFTVV